MPSQHNGTQKWVIRNHCDDNDFRCCQLDQGTFKTTLWGGILAPSAIPGNREPPRQAAPASPVSTPTVGRTTFLTKQPGFKWESVNSRPADDLHNQTAAVGQIARVRQRLYLVENTVPPPRPGDSTLVSLSCVDDDAQGQRLDVLWEREIDPEIMTGGSMGPDRQTRLRSVQTLRRLPEYAQMELRHIDRSSIIPVSVSRRH